ncbi:MAG: Gfo/Idh/MocA family protein, partial [Acetivibrionales bacterium]
MQQKYDIPTVHGTITSLLQDKNIDNIYVCVPNNLHKEMVLAAIEAGKNVLCEKPMGVNKAEVTEMVSAAKQKNVLLMEAMWTRFFPAMEKALSFCNNGTAGNVRSVSIDLGYDGEVAGERGTWHFDNRYGTGALLDMGIYAVFLSHYIFGKKPDHIYGHAYVNNGIDEYNTATLIYGNSHTVLSSSIVNDTSCSVHINCENGVVTIPTYWWHPDKCIFTPKGG